MKNTYQVTIGIATAALSAVMLLVPMPGLGQAPTPVTAADRDKALRAKRLAEQFAAQARVLTVFDRQGKVVTTVGERAFYNNRQPVFSPDRTQLAVIKRDLESETVGLWVLDVTTGKSTLIASNTRGQTQSALLRERAPVWSPDGSQVAYMRVLGGDEGLYRKASNGEGAEELLYQYPGAEMIITDWSKDGRFLSFYTEDFSGKTLYVLPLAGDGERKPIEVFRSECQLRGSRLSPDGRFLGYESDQSGKWEVYVRPFGPAAGAETTSAAGPWQVSDQGIVPSVEPRPGPVFWR